MIRFNDGSVFDEVVVEYPIGHARRRASGIPLLIEKFKANVARIYSQSQEEEILRRCLDYDLLSQTKVSEFTDLLAMR
jgi:2-methylcitrate dehydratase